MRLSMAGFGLTQRNMARSSRSSFPRERNAWRSRTRGGEACVHVLDILYTLVVEPGVERGFAVLDES